MSRAEINREGKDIRETLKIEGERDRPADMKGYERI